MNHSNLEKAAISFADNAKTLGLKLCTAESCTAGLISSTVAMISGSSSWLECGYVVYTPEAKHKMLGVHYETINKFNITSTQVAEEMAIGALKNSSSNLSIAVTGVAGPNGGTENIPVGTVAIAFSLKIHGIIHSTSELLHFSGNRNEIREKVVIHCLHNSVEFFKTHS